MQFESGCEEIVCTGNIGVVGVDVNVATVLDNSGVTVNKIIHSNVGGVAYSVTVTIADDAATFVTPPNFSGFVEVWADTASQLWGKIYFSTSGTALAQRCYGGTLFAETTGVLAGTTGTDTFITVSADSTNNRIYIENRSGAARNVNLFFVAAT